MIATATAPTRHFVHFVRPDNVLLSTEGEPVLMDFGSTAPARMEIKSRTAALDLQDVAAQNSSMQYRAPELFDVPSQNPDTK